MKKVRRKLKPFDLPQNYTTFEKEPTLLNPQTYVSLGGQYALEVNSKDHICGLCRTVFHSHLVLSHQVAKDARNAPIKINVTQYFCPDCAANLLNRFKTVYEWAMGQLDREYDKCALVDSTTHAQPKIESLLEQYKRVPSTAIRRQIKKFFYELRNNAYELAEDEQKKLLNFIGNSIWKCPCSLILLYLCHFGDSTPRLTYNALLLKAFRYYGKRDRNYILPEFTHNYLYVPEEVLKKLKPMCRLRVLELLKKNGTFFVHPGSRIGDPGPYDNLIKKASLALLMNPKTKERMRRLISK